MDTFGQFEIREINLSIDSLHDSWSRFLSANGLREERVGYCLGLFDSSDRLVGTASLLGNVIKEVAIDESVRSGSLANGLVSRLMSYAFDAGHRNVMVFTKPENLRTFRSLSFHKVGEAPGVVLLESDAYGLSSYVKYLSSLRRYGRNGVIVMNANPMTVGHRWLIECAAAEVDNLYVIPVADNESTEFSYDERVDILRRETARFPNVNVCDGSPYTVSASTFPSYFLKEVTSATDTHISLDLGIFANSIAPALGASIRFAGSEPTDVLTRRYNERMIERLPACGIEVRIFDRLEYDNVPVSASSVRRLMRQRSGACRIRKMVTPSALPYVFAHMAADALRDELSLTPKPGLVDMHDSGAHRDMDFHLMSRSIDTLLPWFVKIARVAHCGSDVSEIRALGVSAEKAMMAATHGVNTHRGALFCMGLTLAAACRLAAGAERITPAALSEAISVEAGFFSQSEDTHGASAIRRFGHGGALGNAKAGYPLLFSSWLPFLRSLDDMPEQTACQMTLLKIMSELDDSNILYRCGQETADEVKELSRSLSQNTDCTGLHDSLMRLNREFADRNISPGGAADMLSLTLLADRLLPTDT